LDYHLPPASATRLNIRQ